MTSMKLNTTLNNSAMSECCSHSAEDIRTIVAFTFWVEGILTTLVGVFGLFGNILSISVLRDKEMRNNTFNLLLVVLASVDSILIIFALIDYSIARAFELDIGDVFSYMFSFFLYPSVNIVLCYSIFLVLAIAFERFLAVCHPYEYRNIANTQSVKGRVAKLTIPIFVLAVIINVPKFFETEVTEVEVPGTNETRVQYQVTDLRKNPTYIQIYINWFSLLATGVVPMAGLVFMNVKIYLKIIDVKKSKSAMKTENQERTRLVNVPAERRKERLSYENVTGLSFDCVQFRSPEGSSGCETISVLPNNGTSRETPNAAGKAKQEVSKRDIRMAIILISIVLVFFCCHLPRVLLNLHEFFMLDQILACGHKSFCPPAWYICAITVSHLFLVINSSVNLLIYCSVGEKFRQGIRRKLHWDAVANCWNRLTTLWSSGPELNTDVPLTTTLHHGDHGGGVTCGAGAERIKKLEPRRDV